MATATVSLLIPDPMLLPPREAAYRLQSVYELVAYGCRQEIALDWGDSHLVVRVDEDTDTLSAQFHGSPFGPTEAYRNVGSCSPWDRLVGKECDWTWVAVNKQGYCDIMLLSFDVMLPQVIFHALASSIEVFTISQELKGKNEVDGGDVS